MRELLEKSLPPKRFRHSVRVYETAMQMAEAYGADKERVAPGALLHDCGREIPTKESLAKARELGIDVDDVEAAQPILLHAKLGVYYAIHKYGVKDPEVLAAIRYHSTGTADMSETAKIIFLADMIEPKRDFPGVDELRLLYLEPDARYIVTARGQNLRVGDFGELVRHVVPVKVNPRGVVMNAADALYVMPECAENEEATGAALMSGMRLADRFRGTGYNDSIRMIRDFCSRVYVIQKQGVAQ